MKLLSWNVRGINSYRKQVDLKNLICSFHDYICLMETKVKSHNSGGILQFIGSGWCYITNYEADESERIWILYRPHLRITLFDVTDQVIHCHVYTTWSKEYCFISIIYASNLHSQMHLWTNLRRTKASMMAIPWSLMGISMLY